MKFKISFFIASVILSIGPAFAADPMEGSGLPVPRFASLKSRNAYIRTGPSMDYPIKWIYKREGLPVEIIKEYDSWRKIRDHQGESGWVHKLLLSGQRMALIRSKQVVTAYNEDNMKHAIAQLEPETLVQIEGCEKLVCHATFLTYEGWIEKKNLWGVYDSEIFN